MVYIIAEIGVNWNGDFNIAKEMISKSKEAGCDVVKFQAFNEKIVENHPEKKRLLSTSVTYENVQEINNLAQSTGIEWFCTPMYPEAVDLLLPFVKRFKIRWLDGKPLMQNKTTPLLERVFGTDKEVLISTESSPRNTRFYNNENIQWMYVVPQYPCSLKDLDFSIIKDFDGYSNHCVNYMAPLTAVILGAKIVEVHITSDKSKNFFDNNVSFDYDELKELVKLIRYTEEIKR